jgi:hypothetical protein
VIASYGNRLNHIHVAKMLSRTSQIAAAAAAAAGVPSADKQQQQQVDKQQQHQLYTSLTQMMAQRARHAEPRTLVAAVVAIGRLRALLHGDSSSSSTPAANQQQWQQQLQLLAAQAVGLCDQLNISQLSALLWGFSRAGLNPARAWIDQVLEAAVQAYQAAYERQQQQRQQQGSQPVSDASIGSHAQQQQQLLSRPAPSEQQHQQQHLISVHQSWREHPLHQHSLATDLALILYAAAAMGQPPQQWWLQQWQGAVLQQLSDASAQDLSQFLRGLGVLRQNPGGQQWLDKVLTALADKLEG